VKVVERNLRDLLDYGHEINKQNMEMAVNLVYSVLAFYHFAHRNVTLKI
jgi:hypothetical protein